MRLFLSVCFLFLVSGILFPVSTFAATYTYYVAPDKNLDGTVNTQGNDNYPGTLSQPWKTFGKAWQNIQRGDTLNLMDGIYYQALSPQVPSGTTPITIRALNDGQAIIDGQFQHDPVSLLDYQGASNIIIEGIVAKNGNTTINIQTSNAIIRRVTALNADVDGNSGVIIISGGGNNLLEDCVASGTGRKMIFIFHSENNIIRRCFAHFQSWAGRNFCNIDYPMGAGIEIYDESYNLIENSISFANTPSYGIGLKQQNLGLEAHHNKILGSMVFNSGKYPNNTLIDWPARPQPTTCNYLGYIDMSNQRIGFWFGGLGNLHDNLFQDIFAYNNAARGFSFTDDQPRSNNSLIHATLVGNGSDNPCGGWGCPLGGPTTDITQTELNKFTTVSDSRIDQIANGASRTSMTGQGARLDNRYINGVLTSEPLWPWPMEDRIQDELGVSVGHTFYPVLKTYGSVSGNVPLPSLHLGIYPTPPIRKSPVPGLLQAEDEFIDARCSASNGSIPCYGVNDIPGGGKKISNISPTLFIKYRLNVTQANTYNISVLTASNDSSLTKQLQLTVDSQTPITKTLPFTGSWNTFQTTSFGDFTLNLGLHLATFTFITGGYDLDAINVIQKNITPISYDLDGDTDVDFLDLLKLITGFNASGPGNFNLTGLVDIFDFNILLQKL